jgi:hypothetical protein
VVHKIVCSVCPCEYIGQTKNSLFSRLKQHKTALKLLQTEKSAVAQLSLDLGQKINFVGARTIKRELHYAKTRQSINRIGDDKFPGIYSSILFF